MAHNYIIEEISASCLKTDFGYQREPQLIRVKKIASNWQDDLAKDCIVSMRSNGEFYILDGNHTRLAKMKVYGEDVKVQAKIYEGLTVEEEAHMFRLLYSNSVTPNYNEKLKASIYEGEKASLEYINCFKETGCEYTFHRGSTGTQFCAHKTGVYCFQNYGKDVFCEALRLLVVVNRQELYAGSIVGGVCRLLQEENIEKDRLIKILRSINADEVNVSAKSNGARSRGNESKSNNIYAFVMATIYNKGLPHEGARRLNIILSSK